MNSIRTFTRLVCKGKAALLLACLPSFLSWPATAAAQAEPEAEVTVTLDEAIARALARSPDVVRAEGAVRAASAGKRRAYGAFLPTLDGGASASTEESGTETYSAGLSSSLDLFDAANFKDLRRARAVARGAEAGALDARYALGYRVQTAFYAVLRAEDLIAVAEARIQRAKEGQAAAERRSQVGSATRSDILRAELELNTAQDTLLQYRTDRRSAAYALGRLIGADGPASAKREGKLTPDRLSRSDASLLDELVSRAPSVRSAQAAFDVSRASAAAARSAYLPTLRATGTYDWGTTDLNDTSWGSRWTVRVGLALPIFDGFRREESVISARAAQRAGAAALADEKRAVRAELARVLGQVRLQEERITLAEKAVEVAGEDARVQEERYKLGVTTILERLASETALVEAQNNLVAARFDWQLSRAELEALAGRTP